MRRSKTPYPGVREDRPCGLESSILGAWVAGVLMLFVLLAVGLLPAGVLAFVLCAVVATAFFVWRSKPRGALSGVTLERVAWLLAPLALIATFIYSRWGFSYFIWDDLSHWARATKFIAEKHSIFTSPYIASPTYPPGLALLHYSLLSVLGYQEQTALFIQFAFLAICVAVICAPIASQSGAMGLAAVFCVLAAIYLFRLGLDDTTADVPLGLLLAAICVVAYTEKSLFAILSVNVLLVAFLVTVKQVGLPFAFAGVGITSLMILARRKDLAIERPLATFLGSCALLSSSALAPYFMWQLASNASAASGNPLTGFAEIWNAVTSGTMSPRFATTLNEFIFRMGTTEPPSRPQLFGIPGVWGVSPIMMIVSLTITSIGAALLVPRRRLPGVMISGVLAMGVCAYILLLFSLYLDHFTEYEGTALASFERYLAGYCLAWMSFTIVMVLMAISARVRPMLASLLAVSVIGGGVYLLQPLGDVLAREWKYQQREVLTVRREVQELARVAQRNLKSGEKVYFLKQGDTGFAFFAFQFEMMNNGTQAQCWSLGAPVNPTDVWSCELDLDVALKGYSILVIDGTNPSFWEHFGKFFDAADKNTQRGVFRVHWIPDHGASRLMLQRVSND